MRPLLALPYRLPLRATAGKGCGLAASRQPHQLQRSMAREDGWLGAAPSERRRRQRKRKRRALDRRVPTPALPGVGALPAH
uniref:Uncharacterized protein n=1 Tax=Oryza barthii TaxID=65489 RepID=A0A0D3H7J9_9ORYZ